MTTLNKKISHLIKRWGNYHNWKAYRKKFNLREKSGLRKTLYIIPKAQTSYKNIYILFKILYEILVKN